MNFELILLALGLLLTSISYIVYISVRFSKLETIVLQHARDNEEFREMRQMFYKMSAQMDLILNKTVEKNN